MVLFLGSEAAMVVHGLTTKDIANEKKYASAQVWTYVMILYFSIYLGSQVREWKFGSRDIHSKLYLSYFYSLCEFFALPFMNKTKTHHGGILSGLILWIGLTH